MPPAHWVAQCEWPAEVVFIIGGGTSVLSQDLEQLRGRRVIVINSSVHAVPWADFLFFADHRWYCEAKNRAAVQSFAGRVITTSRMVNDPKVLRMRRFSPKHLKPPGLTFERDALAVELTSITAATNLAVHLAGPGSAIVWLGIDGRADANGRTWHHEPHKAKPLKDRYAKHRSDIVTMVEPLKRAGIRIWNASPGSTYGDLWPVVTLRDVLGDTEQARAA